MHGADPEGRLRATLRAFDLLEQSPDEATLNRFMDTFGPVAAQLQAGLTEWSQRRREPLQQAQQRVHTLREALAQAYGACCCWRAAVSGGSAQPMRGVWVEKAASDGAGDGEGATGCRCGASLRGHRAFCHQHHCRCHHQ